MIFGIKIKIYHFDLYNVFLDIATNIPVQLKTGFVVQGHIYNITKYFLFQINAILLNFLFIKESWNKMHHGHHKYIRKHNCF